MRRLDKYKLVPSDSVIWAGYLGEHKWYQGSNVSCLFQRAGSQSLCSEMADELCFALRCRGSRQRPALKRQCSKCATSASYIPTVPPAPAPPQLPAYSSSPAQVRYAHILSYSFLILFHSFLWITYFHLHCGSLLFSFTYKS